jgi:hypothetical protein
VPGQSAFYRDQQINSRIPLTASINAQAQSLHVDSGPP